MTLPSYYGRWKALQYYARRFYADLLISPHRENERLEFYVVSDRTKVTKARIAVSLMDFEGRVLVSKNQAVEIAPLQSKSYLSLPVSDLLQGKDAKTVMLVCELLVEGQAVTGNEVFFEPYKNLSMPTPQIKSEVTQTRDGFKITLTSDKFARAVYLSVTQGDGFFSDNYFDLLPGRKVAITFRTSEAMSLNDFRNRLKIRSLVDAFR